MTVRFTFEDIDLGYKATKRGLAGMNDLSVDVGLFDEEQVKKGAWAELGTKRTVGDKTVVIRPRPWLSVAGDVHAYRMADAVGQAAGEVADRKSTPRKALRPVGKAMVEATKGVITNGQVGGDDLAESTIKRKGHATKLLDTRAMLRAIKFVITKDGANGE